MTGNGNQAESVSPLIAEGFLFFTGDLRPTCQPGHIAKLAKQEIVMARAVRAKNQKQAPIPATSLKYRPRDYFGRYDLQTELLTHVKGRARRSVIRQALDDGKISDVPSYIKVAELDALDRQMIGRIHPMYMGGEYLPKLKPAEIEVARISIKSTTFDVTVLYARLVGRRIHYRVADEYGGDTLSSRSKRTSLRPLTMGQMIEFFLGAWDLMACLEGNFDDDIDGMLDFFDGESEFYPYFDATLREMVMAQFPEKSAFDGDPERGSWG